MVEVTTCLLGPLVVPVVVVGAGITGIAVPVVILEVLEVAVIRATMVQEQLAVIRVELEPTVMQDRRVMQTVVGRDRRVMLEEQDRRVMLGLLQTQI